MCQPRMDTNRHEFNGTKRGSHGSGERARPGCWRLRKLSRVANFPKSKYVVARTIHQMWERPQRRDGRDAKVPPTFVVRSQKRNAPGGVLPAPFLWGQSCLRGYYFVLNKA